MQVVCGHCGRAVDTETDLGQGLQCPRCASKVTTPDITGELAAPADPDETAVIEAIDVSFADKARQALRKSAKIHLSCGSCGKHLTVGARLAGKRAKCPNCKDHIRIPYPDDQDDFEIEALAMAYDADSEDLDLANVDGANVAAAALHQAEKRTAGSSGKSTRREAAERRLEVRAMEARRGRRRLILQLVVAVLVVWGVVMYFAWPWIAGNGDAENGSGAGVVHKGGANGDGPDNGSANNGNGGTTTHQATNGNGEPKPVPKAAPPKFRVAKVEVTPFAHDGYFPASPGRVYWRITIDVKAGGEPLTFQTRGPQAVLTAMGQEYLSLGDVAWEGVVPRRTRNRTLQVIPGTIRRFTLLYELPAEFRRGDLVLAEVGSVTVEPDELAQPGDEMELLGEFVETSPRNLKPMLRQPVMAAIQTAGPDRLIVKPTQGGYGVSIPAAEVHGVATYRSGGEFDVTLHHDGEELPATLRLTDGGERVLLYLHEAPWHQVTYLRRGASLDENGNVVARPKPKNSHTRPSSTTKSGLTTRTARDKPEKTPDTKPGNGRSGGLREPTFFGDDDEEKDDD